MVECSTPRGVTAFCTDTANQWVLVHGLKWDYLSVGDGS
jgi:hypothetical protein